AGVRPPAPARMGRRPGRPGPVRRAAGPAARGRRRPGDAAGPPLAVAPARRDHVGTAPGRRVAGPAGAGPRRLPGPAVDPVAGQRDEPAAADAEDVAVDREHVDGPDA